ncbi:MAG TPA: DUF5522 domain-containing protein [Gemmataceae bacterium]|nr:DUF5522 domain-containing protein [Gemmataceae bacterium]
MPNAEFEPSPPDPLIEGRDYYVVDGLWVFTADYLRRRGFCCGSGCRHCPYPSVDRPPGTPLAEP